jgi:hypothetical protein
VRGGYSCSMAALMAATSAAGSTASREATTPTLGGTATIALAEGPVSVQE